MSRITMALLVAATAGVAGWWAAQRSAARGSTMIASQPQTPTASPAPQATPAQIDPKMVVTPKRDVDPNMVVIMPDVDPKMIVTPPESPAPNSDPPRPSSH